ASRFRQVLHCDLSVDSLNYAAAKARAIGIHNVTFLRIDYLRPPFRGCLQRILCCDTLIRGLDHDQRLLSSIRNSLRSDGVALVDFHNWWHNPLRRVALLPQNFGDNVSYRREQVERLLKRQRIVKLDALGFHQELSAAGPWIRPLGRILPATRLVYRVTHDA